jgi:hypothetical protein
MHRGLFRSVIAALLLSGAAFGQSKPDQSLGDVARANRAKQQAQEASGTLPKVIRNQDLPADPQGVPESSPSDPMTEVSGVDRPSRYADQQLTNRLAAEQHTTGQWRARIQDQENRIVDLQSRIDHLDAAIHNSVGTAQYDTPVNRYQAIQMERLAMMQQMLDQQKRRLAMMEDAARRAGMNQ